MAEEVKEIRAGEILFQSERLILRRAEQTDLDYIMELMHKEENISFIVPFPRDFHEKIIAEGVGAMDVIVTEKDGTRVGYYLLNGLTNEANEMEWTHVIMDKKGMGYGHESMKLIKKWTFEVKKFHRAWMDCKDYNTRALHLYESEGMVREGLIRETLLTNGVYENLVVLGILDREYFARKADGLEI